MYKSWLARYTHSVKILESLASLLQGPGPPQDCAAGCRANVTLYRLSGTGLSADFALSFPDNNYFRTQSVQDMMTNVSLAIDVSSCSHLGQWAGPLRVFQIALRRRIPTGDA